MFRGPEESVWGISNTKSYMIRLDNIAEEFLFKKNKQKTITLNSKCLSNYKNQKPANVKSKIVYHFFTQNLVYLVIFIYMHLYDNA